MQHVSLLHSAASGVRNCPARFAVLDSARAFAVTADPSLAASATPHRGPKRGRIPPYSSPGRLFFVTLLALSMILCSCAGFVSEKTDPAGLTIMTGTLAAGQVGVPYSQQITVAGGTAPYTWTISQGSLPPGMNLTSSGVLSGVPSAPGQYSFVITVTDSNQAASSVRVGM